MKVSYTDKLKYILVTGAIAAVIFLGYRMGSLILSKPGAPPKDKQSNPGTVKTGLNDSISSNTVDTFPLN